MNSLLCNPNLLKMPKRELKVWTWILIFTLLFNATFPGVVKNLFFANSEKILLCATGGYKWVSILKYELGEKGNSHCVFCLNFDEPVIAGERLQFNVTKFIRLKFKSSGLSSFHQSLRFFMPLNRAPPSFS